MGSVLLPIHFLHVICSERKILEIQQSFLKFKVAIYSIVFLEIVSIIITKNGKKNKGVMTFSLVEKKKYFYVIQKINMIIIQIFFFFEINDFDTYAHILNYPFS